MSLLVISFCLNVIYFLLMLIKINFFDIIFDLVKFLQKIQNYQKLLAYICMYVYMYVCIKVLFVCVCVCVCVCVLYIYMRERAREIVREGII